MRTPETFEGSFCPWCIADGSANGRYSAEFTDVISGVPHDIPKLALEEIASRTPGFFGWQQEQWLYHCSDGAAYMGTMGAQELAKFPQAVEAIRQEALPFDWQPDEIDAYVESLRTDDSPSAYLFQCLKCDEYLAYSDFT